MRLSALGIHWTLCSLLALASLPGCAGGSRRDAPGRGDASSADQAPRDWRRLTVIAAILEPGEGKKVLTVRTKTPSAGWKIEIRQLPGKEDEIREFEVVGLPPASEEGTSEEHTLRETLDLGDKVDHVLVHGSEGAFFAS
jgi:hypothetical protein